MNTTTTISNNDDVIDSRDVIARIEELKDELGLSEGDFDEHGVNLRNSFNADPEKADLYAELKALEALAEEAEQYSSDWTHGETLIRRSYFVDYISEIISDCYELPKELTSGIWPYRHIKIDYEAAADEAEQDYTSVDFDGVEYLIRSC